jgi:F-box protein 18 (helicase)
MLNTEEQQSIVCDDSDFLVVDAFSGSGKTTTLASLALARPREKMLYIAFSKAIQMEAMKKFPSHVKCMTSHGLAFPKYGSLYANANKLAMNLRANEVCDLLDLSPYPDQYHYYIADACIKTLLRYFSSAHHDIEQFMVIGLLIPDSTVEASDIVALTKILWTRMQDVNDLRAGMLHDGYLKLFQLSSHLLPYDRILFDEVQDANPVTTSIFTSQLCKKVAVGDPHQSIFAFRMASNTMQQLTPDKTLCLTKSFRFGREIADVANILLSTYKNETREIVGNGKPSVIGSVPKNEQYAVIARSNSTLFSEAIAAISEKKKIYYVGGAQGYRLQDMLDAYYLYAGEPSQIKNSYIKSFKSFDAMEDFSILSDDKDIKSLVNIVQNHGSTLPMMLKKVRYAVTDNPKEAQVHLSTAHKSKGLEWDNVRLANDFMPLKNDDGLVRKLMPAEEEDANILYVAATRAKKVLQPYKNLEEFLIENKLMTKVNPRPIWAR